MTVDQIKQAAKMWHDGMLAKNIAEALGVTQRIIFYTAETNREMFPVRKLGVGRKRTRQRLEKSLAKRDAGNPSDRMQWVTDDGSAVTLPRISFIECPRRLP